MTFDFSWLQPVLFLTEGEFVVLASLSLCPVTYFAFSSFLARPFDSLSGTRMENPILTFVTPTLLSGDRSQISVVAHEAAHSWSGNLVTNSNWEHFWLNEGFTVFFERKIVGRIWGEEEAELHSLLGWESLKADIETMIEQGKGVLTKLVKDLRGKDPDDAFSSVPYEKGFALLYYLQKLLGGPEVFEPYLKAYIANFAHKSITTEDWKKHLFAYFSDARNPGAGHAAIEKLNGLGWNAWMLGEGMPPVTLEFDRTLAKQADVLADKWKDAMVKAPKDGNGAKEYYEGVFKKEDMEEFSPTQKSK